MHRFKDQTDSEVVIHQVPKRIVSLVPSQTELLFDLGLSSEISGITKFCIHPKNLCDEKTKVGGTKSVNHAKIEKLRPDLIIGNKEENTLSDIELLRKDYPVWLSDVVTKQDAMDMIKSIGELTNKKNESSKIIKDIQVAFDSWNEQKPIHKQSAIYLIWKDPYMAAGNNTFIHSMMECFGWKNLLDSHDRYPELSPEQINEWQPDNIILSSEPYPFSEKHIPEVQVHFPKSKIHLVDATYFSWYGSRMIHAPQYFHKLTSILN